MGWIEGGFTALNTLIGLKSREKNLRESIDTTRQLMLASTKVRGINQRQLQSKIEKVLDYQLINLTYIEENRIRIRDWGSLLVGFIFITMFGGVATIAVIAGGLILTIIAWIFYILTFICMLALSDLYRKGKPITISEENANEVQD